MYFRWPYPLHHWFIIDGLTNHQFWLSGSQDSDDEEDEDDEDEDDDEDEEPVFAGARAADHSLWCWIFGWVV